MAAQLRPFTELAVAALSTSASTMLSCASFGAAFALRDVMLGFVAALGKSYSLYETKHSSSMSSSMSDGVAANKLEEQQG
jgi:hypothetical protein